MLLVLDILRSPCRIAWRNPCSTAASLQTSWPRFREVRRMLDVTLIAPAVDDGPTICPVAEATGSIKMSTPTQANVLGAPGCNLYLGVRCRCVGIIVAAHHRHSIFAQ